MAHAPKELLAKNFGVPASTFDGFPTDEVYFARGKKPPEEQPVPILGTTAVAATHRYQLLSQDPHRVYKGGREWRVDSGNFPISKTVTGVVLDLDPGALRELHWHPTADEWQYVIDGDISVTLFGAKGRYRTETLSKGDVGYIPQGYGHSIENVGKKPCRVLIGFNTGVYQTVDLSQWIGANPLDVLATNFGKPASVFEEFPRRDVFIADKEGR
jgi:oxalate decarboxylase